MRLMSDMGIFQPFAVLKLVFVQPSPCTPVSELAQHPIAVDSSGLARD